FRRDSLFWFAGNLPGSKMLVRVVIHCLQIGWAIKGDHCAYGKVLSFKFGRSKQRVVCSVGCEKGKVSARRATADNNSIGIYSQPGCILFHPNDSSLYITYHSHHVRLRSEAICYVHDHMPLRRQMRKERT